MPIGENDSNNCYYEVFTVFMRSTRVRLIVDCYTCRDITQPMHWFGASSLTAGVEPAIIAWFRSMFAFRCESL